jgi:hypothetical protein
MISIAWHLGIGAELFLYQLKSACYFPCIIVCVYMCVKYVPSFEAIVTNTVHGEKLSVIVSLSSHSHDVMDF